MKVTRLDEAPTPFILSLDLGSSSIRALLYDANGNQLDASETQIEHELRSSPDGGSEGDAAALFNLVCDCVDGVLEWAGDRTADIGAVATSSFWHSLLALDGSGEPLSPVLMWSDKRSGVDVPDLIARFPPEALHQRTGCRPHSSYWPAKLLWYRRTQSETWSTVARWTSFADYVTLKLTGEMLTSLSMASGTGLLDISGKTWDTAVLSALDITPACLPDLTDRDRPLPKLLGEYGRRWPPLAEVSWYPAIGDGAAANVGAGCIGTDRIAVTVGTSAAMRMIMDDASGAGSTRHTIPSRIWNYRLDREHRVVGGALSNAGNVTSWLARHMAQGEFEDLSRNAAQVPPDGHGLTILPFLAGERSPSWNDAATGTISGIRLSTTPADIFRATLEATAYRIATIYDDLKPLVDPHHEIHVNGAAALSSPMWIQIIADTLGHRVEALDADAEASARGAALCALQALGMRPDLRGIGEEIAQAYEPHPGHHAVYTHARQRQDWLEAAMSAFQNET
jgi:gluconokinase